MPNRDCTVRNLVDQKEGSRSKVFERMIFAFGTRDGTLSRRPVYSAGYASDFPTLTSGGHVSAASSRISSSSCADSFYGRARPSLRNFERFRVATCPRASGVVIGTSLHRRSALHLYRL